MAMTSKTTSQDGEEPRTGYFQLNTDHLPPADRLEFWYETTGRRMTCQQVPEKEVHAKIQGLVGNHFEFLDYEAESFLMSRDRKMCNRDGRDEISIGLVLSAKSGAIQDGLELPLSCGELYVIDFGKPVDSVVPVHHELAIALPRKLVRQTIGGHVNQLAGQKLSRRGIGGLLAAHMTAMAKEAQYLTPVQQQIAMHAASDLALATLRAADPSATGDFARFSDGIYLAACRTIHQHCRDHSFDVAKLAAIMGCSRASIYRLFRSRGRSVSGTIWRTRLKIAARMLRSPDHVLLSISDISLSCGFLDLSSFSKMFKRQFGMSPSDWRASQIKKSN
jgi:AraC-like DNA-binding protein